MTKQEMDAYCKSCGGLGKVPCNRRKVCEECGKQEGCLEICVMEHRDGAKYGRAENA